MKKIFLTCSLPFGSILFIFLLLEFFLRISPNTNELYYQRLAWGHWRNSSKMPKWYNELYVYDEVLGYEKKEIYTEIKKILQNNSSSYKILVLGDSVTERGNYVDYFKNLLVDRYKNKDIKIVNAGVMGYNTELEYNYLEYRGLELNPNLVIMQFSPNDFEGSPVIIKQRDGSWLALDGSRKLSKWINPYLLIRSKAYEFVALRILSLSKRGSKMNNSVKEPLRRIKQLLEEKEIPFYFIVFPVLAESDAGRRKHYRIIQITKELKLTTHTINLLPHFSRVPFESIRNDPHHPNSDGDKITATVLMEKLTPFFDEQFN